MFHELQRFVPSQKTNWPARNLDRVGITRTSPLQALSAVEGWPMRRAYGCEGKELMFRECELSRPSFDVLRFPPAGFLVYVIGSVLVFLLVLGRRVVH
jgi:hypothetical protein